MSKLKENSRNSASVEKPEALSIEHPSEQKSLIKHEKKEKRGKKQLGVLSTNLESYEEQKKKLDDAEQSVAKASSKKKKIINLLFFFLNIAVVAGILIYQLNGEDFTLIHGLKLNVLGLFMIVLMFVLHLLFDNFATSYLLKASTGRWRFGLSYKVNAIGRYYDSVTPLATGGQPFQITYLKSHDVPIHTALSIPLAKYLFQQIAWVLLSLICLIVSFTNPNYNGFVSIVSVIGFVLSSVVLIAAVFLSISKSFGRKLVVKVLKLLAKMKIIKNYDKQYIKITKYIEDFQSVMQQYAKSPKDFCVMFITCMLRLFFYYSIPYFIFCMFKGFESQLYLNFFVMSLLVDLASSFFPLPGGTGMNEVSFTAMFAGFFESNLVLFWVLITWRFFSYYIFLVQGVCLLTYDMAYGNRKYKWQVKKERLSEESRIFKQNQIDKFRADRLKRRYTTKNRSQRNNNKVLSQQ